MARQPGQSRLNARLSRLTSRLDDHKLLLGVLVAIVGAFLGYVAFISTTGPPFQTPYVVNIQTPADAPTLRAGQEVRIAGRLAGLISEVEPDRENGGATVTANITKTEFRPIGSDALAYVRVHSIVYRTYLEIIPGNTDDPLESEGVIPQDRVSSGVDLLEVVQLFDREARESVRGTVVNLGYGVAGRGNGLNDALADLEPISKNLRKQLEAATSEEGALGRATVGASRLTRGLEGTRADDVASLISSAAAVFGEVSTRPNELAATIQNLRPFEDEFLTTAPLAEPLLDDLARTAVQLEPAIRGLNSALPAINQLLSLGDLIESETARITAVTRPVLRTTTPLVRDIYPTVAALKILLPDVDTIVETITPYRNDISVAGQGLADATSVFFPFGHGVGIGAPAGRVIPIVTPQCGRNPFPGPGDSTGDTC